MRSRMRQPCKRGDFCIESGLTIFARVHATRAPEEETRVFEVAEKFIQRHAAGEAIFREGDAGEDMYFVLSGRVDIVQGEGGDRKRLATLGSGEMFGEMALVLGGQRFASAIASQDDTRVMAIDQARFVYLVSQQPAFALSVMRVMAQRLAGQPNPQAMECAA